MPEEIKVKTRKKSKNKTNKELFWIIFVMVLAIVILLVSPYISQRFNTFDYNGLSFTKERFGELVVYQYYYYYTDLTNQQVQYNLYLYGDPRKNNVSIDGKIVYPPSNSTVYVSVNGTSLVQCQNSLRDIASLGNFIRDNGFNVHPGDPDKDVARNNNITYVTCSTNPDDMVVLLTYGNETKINVNNKCYTISFDQCQQMDAIEKFEVQSVIDAKSRAKN